MVCIHTYTFFDESNYREMRILEGFLDENMNSLPFGQESFRDSVLLVDPNNKAPITVYVDGKQYNPREYARYLYRDLLGIGFCTINETNK